MKRDMDLIRLLLLEVESDQELNLTNEFTEPELIYHSALLVESELVHGTVIQNETGVPVGTAIQRLTWKGHELIDAIRDDGVWNQTIKSLKEVGKSWSISLVKFTATEFLKKKVLGL